MTAMGASAITHAPMIAARVSKSVRARAKATGIAAIPAINAGARIVHSEVEPVNVHASHVAIVCGTWLVGTAYEPNATNGPYTAKERNDEISSYHRLCDAIDRRKIAPTKTAPARAMVALRVGDGARSGATTMLAVTRVSIHISSGIATLARSSAARKNSAPRTVACGIAPPMRAMRDGWANNSA